DALGFVLGHELAHVVNQHTLHSDLFRAAVQDSSVPLDPSVVTHVSRLQEIEADRVGMVWAFLAGYNPRGGIAVVEVQGREHEVPSGVDHPTFDERVHYLEEYWSNDVRYAFLAFSLGVDEMQKGNRIESVDVPRATAHYQQAIEYFRVFRNTITA